MFSEKKEFSIKLLTLPRPTPDQSIEIIFSSNQSPGSPPSFLPQHQQFTTSTSPKLEITNMIWNFTDRQNYQTKESSRIDQVLTDMNNIEFSKSLPRIFFSHNFDLS